MSPRLCAGAGKSAGGGVGAALHAAVGTASGGGTGSAKGSVVLVGGHKYGFRKNWGKSEFVQDALQALYAETLPVYASAKVLEEVRAYLAHNAKYLATYGGKKIDRTTVTRALQKLSKARR